MNWYLVDILLPGARPRVRTVVDALGQAVVRVRAASPRMLVLSGVALVLLVVALVVAVRSRSDADVPTNEFVGFNCSACGRHFDLNHRQFKELWDKREYKAGPAKSSLLFKCVYCGKLTAVRADQAKPTTQSAARTP